MFFSRLNQAGRNTDASSERTKAVLNKVKKYSHSPRSRNFCSLPNFAGKALQFLINCSVVGWNLHFENQGSGRRAQMQ